MPQSHERAAGGADVPWRSSAWIADHPVLEELRRRRSAGSTPGDRRARGEATKIGLAVEGGGMRGIFSAAMLYALEELEVVSAFDAVYGLSSGAVNGAYFLAGETWLPLSIYYDDLATKDFVDFSRPLRGQPIMDLDYVFEDVLVRRKPLDYERVLSSDVPLCVGVTLVDRLETSLVREFEGPEDLKAALRASCWLPGAVGGTATFRGERALDGGVLTAHPYALAVEDGCTHVLSLSTHSNAPRRYNPLALRYAYRHLERFQPGLGLGYAQALERNARDLRRFKASTHAPTPEPFVLDMGPLPRSPVVRRHEMDKGVLMEAARNGYELMFSAISKRPVSHDGVTSLRAVPRFSIVENAAM